MFNSRNGVKFCGYQTTDVRQADRAQSAETLLSPLSHVPLSSKNSTSVINSIATISPGIRETGIFYILNHSLNVLIFSNLLFSF